jgi:hypothetical protein
MLEGLGPKKVFIIVTIIVEVITDPEGKETRVPGGIF